MTGSRIASRSLLALFATLLAAAVSLTTTSAAQARTRVSWHIVPDPHFGTMNGIDAVSSLDIWAAGWYYDQPQGRNLPLAEHYTGSAWTAMTAATDRPGYNAFNAVSAVSSNDVWAVGYSTPRYYSYLLFPMIQHWDGSSWKVVPSPTVGRGELKGVEAIANDDVWAVGTQGYAPSGVLVEHWDGSSWSLVDAGHAEDSGTLNAISARNANDIWAGGSYLGGGKTLTLAEHWNGSTWTTVATPSPAYLNDFEAISIDPAGSEVWAVGWTSPGIGSDSLTERYDGTSWKVVESDASIPFLYGVVSLSPTSAWAVGYTSGVTPLTQHWNGTSWAIVPTPNTTAVLYAITVAGRTLWTVGEDIIMRRP